MKESSIYEVVNPRELEDIMKHLSKIESMSCFRDKSVREEFARKQIKFGHVYAQKHGDIPIAVACFYCNDKESRIAYITALVLGDELGISKGVTMIEFARKFIGLCRQNDMKTIRLEVANTNSRARRLYEHVGFTYTGEEKKDSSYMEMPLDEFEAVFCHA